MSFRICDTACRYEKEYLKTSFDFKGNALTCLWQTAVCLKTSSNVGIGLGVQSVLWSDSAVYSKMGEENGNRAMYRITRYAADLLKNAEVDTPIRVIEDILPELFSYALRITDSPRLRKTFVLNALVPIDLALWQLWYKENKKTSFDDISTFDGQRQSSLLNIPLITYNTPLSAVNDLASGGASLLKIKVGSNPLGNNDLDPMLEWDKKRILDIHKTVGEITSPNTVSGKVLYYLDANGRYDGKERVMRLLDSADRGGFLDRIVLLEEPFDEKNKLDVRGIPVTVAADESAHSPDDVDERCDLGYKALALKPIAKTLSVTVQMAERARKNAMSCFCADLTVNPVMVSWNQCVAARLYPIPQMKIGVVESNGGQNYRRWEDMMSYHPLSECAFTRCENGVFHLGSEFYSQDAGIFCIPSHYAHLFEKAVDE